ncbi:hypothetical protein EAE99_009265 [Botrytis elliptica]|nr:hypothetical protein EAE99_009265 [Botrytis elliptica]
MLKFGQEGTPKSNTAVVVYDWKIIIGISVNLRCTTGSYLGPYVSPFIFRKICFRLDDSGWNGNDGEFPDQKLNFVREGYKFGDNMFLEWNHWLESYIRYSIQQLTNVHVVTFFLRKSDIKDLRDNKAHRDGTGVLHRKPQDGDIVHETEIYGSSDKVEEEKEEEEEEPDFEGVSNIDDDAATASGRFESSGGNLDEDFTVADDGNVGGDQSSSEDSDNDSEDSLPHRFMPACYYRGLKLTSQQLKVDWRFARWELWKPIWEEFSLKGMSFQILMMLIFQRKGF